MKGDLNWLKLALDTSRPDQILVSSSRSQQKLVEDEHNITLRDIDPALSVLAASYKLIITHPSRFCQQQPQEPNENTWGIHHEEWMRAYAVICFACEKHISFAISLEMNPSLTLFTTKLIFSHTRQKSKSFGYITDELLPQAKAPDGPGRTTTMQLDQETDFLELEHSIAEMGNLSQLATKDEINQTINAIELFQSKITAKSDHIIQDTDGALSEIIIEAVCTTLGTIVPGTDLDKGLGSLEVATKMRRPPITENETEALRMLLKSRFYRVQLDASKHTASDNEHPQYVLQPVIIAEDATRPDKANGHISSKSSIDLKRLRKARARLGENLPTNQDLTSICSLRGIDVNSLSVNPHNPPQGAKAPQILGMFFFSIIKQHILVRGYFC